MKKAMALCFLITTGLACGTNASKDEGEPVEQKKQELREGITIVNGVERSELALTMREMYDQMKTVRDSLARGEEIQTKFLSRFKSIHTDHATEPEKIDDVYNGMASSFLTSYERFEESDTNRVEAFNQMLDACLACHQQKCPGPIKAINKLKLD
ncbi:MAG TPA: hypothetical protein DCX14_06205 [Flavobacteriales bacterium]|jgi:hypothetical protein|nr:hypothetical protein [Flavobacteriales bacterium]HAW19757.1 hypothetical protein [Flavobacteriales bacterium]